MKIEIQTAGNEFVPEGRIMIEVTDKDMKVATSPWRRFWNMLLFRKALRTLPQDMKTIGQCVEEYMDQVMRIAAKVEEPACSMGSDN